MISMKVTLGGKTHTVYGGLRWVNLSTSDAGKPRRPDSREGSRPTAPAAQATGKPMRQLKAEIAKQRLTHGCLVQDANEPPNWMLGTLKGNPKDAIAGIVWVARSNPNERILYVEQHDGGATWLVATDQGRMANSPGTDELVTNDKLLSTYINDLLELWTTEDVPYRIVLNLRNRITTPLLERAIQAKQASTGKLEDLLKAPPPAEARLTRLQPLPLAHAVVMLTVIAGIGYFAWDWYAARRALQEQIAEQQREQLAAAGVDVTQEQLAQLDATAQETAVLEALKADTATPDPQAVIMACANLMARIQSYDLGWELGEVTCAPEGTTASATYRLPLIAGKLGGSNASIEALSAEASVQYFTDYQKAVATFPIEPPPIRGSLTREALPESKSWVKELGQRLQDLRTADLRLQASVSGPDQRSIQYQVPVDPTVEQTAGPKFADVSPERGYMEGRVILSGEGALTMTQMQPTETNIRLTKLTLVPGNAGWSWNMEFAYVCR